MTSPKVTKFIYQSDGIAFSRLPVAGVDASKLDVDKDKLT